MKGLFGTAMNIPEEPQIVGALGASLFARDRVLKRR
jgi:activator of 2-hydroxyglutaryl-CoA dehydratase